jgi:RNA polymerase sigma-70 factor (ECF subfamily)
VIRQAFGRDSAHERERIFVRHLDAWLDRSYGLANVILGDGSEAEEATHDAVLAAWRGLDGLRDPARVEAWFTRILVNVCRDRLRRRRVRPIAVGLPAALPAPGPGTDLGTLEALERAVRSLTPEQRAVVVLRFWGDLSIDEIAVRTGARSGTVKSRLHYALERLRAAYERGERDGGTDDE